MSACESVEDKAERLYQESVELVEEGDVDRALITLRNVFNADGDHIEARLLYAELQLEQGNLDQAYGHYLLAAEQQPDLFEPRIHLAELALRGGNWPEAERHASAAIAIEPENIQAQAIQNVIHYRNATQNGEPVDAMVTNSEEILKSHPDNTFARRLVIDDLVRKQQIEEALEVLDVGLEIEPDNFEFSQMKLAMLAEQNDMAALGEHLKGMVAQFTENEAVRSSLIRWYLTTGDTEGAEGFLRDLVAQSEEEVAPRVTLVQFLHQVHGYEAALDELDQLIAEGTDDVGFRMMKAGLIYDNRDRQEAISMMEELLDGAEPSDETREIQTTFARMLIGIGEDDRAREIVDAVLGEDNQDVEALKLKANWQIDDDSVRDAILGLRTALDQSPRDAEAITLLARAYERDGDRELMADSLALAVEASNNAPTESLRYASHLIQTEKLLTAEDVLLNSLRTAPTNIALLRTLGQVYIALGDWPRAEQVINTLNPIGSEEAEIVATALQATVFQRMERTDESIDLLRSMAVDGQPGIAAQAAIIRTHLANGDLAAARIYMDELLGSIEGEEPSERSDGIHFLNAALLAVEGNLDAAQATYRDLADRSPEDEAIWRAYAATYLREGQPNQAEAIIDEGLAALPNSSGLLWLKASLLEDKEDFDAAIDIYTRLYDENSNSTVVANNLASLITTYRDDDESLQQAYQIARRLRGVEIPAMQDTYGWIAYRLGNTNEALEYLEPAAAALPDDPTVQYHLAKAYSAAGRSEEAAPLFRRAVEMWEGTNNPQLADARAELEQISASPRPAATE